MLQQKRSFKPVSIVGVSQANGEGQPSVEDMEKFELIMEQIEGLLEEQTLRDIVSGLNNGLGGRMKTHGPTTITRAMDLAHLIKG